jgi:DNA-binding NarL/FixJ family response regulator
VEAIMTGFGVAVGQEALVRACDADRLIWSTGADSGRHRQARNRAVAEALAGGVSIEQIADDLGVLIKDVEGMAASAGAADGSGPPAAG